MALGAGRKGKSPAPVSVETRDSGESRPDADSAEDATPAERGTGASSSGSSGVDSTPHVITGRYRPVETWTRAASISSGEASSSRAPASARTRPTKSVDAEDVDGLPPPTHVHVAVVSCSGLRGSDWTGYADPFVEVGAFGADKKHRYRTSVAKMTLNPTWNPRLDRFLVRCGENDRAEPETFRGIVVSVFDRDWGSASEFLGGAVIAARDVPRGGRWAELKLDLQRRLPPDAVGVDGKKNKHVVPASAPAALGTVTVRIAAADDMSWDVLSDTGAVTTRPALLAFAPGKFGASKIRAYAAGYRVMHKSVSQKAGAARTLHPKLIRHVHVCVIAGKHLAASDAGRLTDAFVRARLDNGALREEKRTGVRRKTLDPVWGAGAGETFTLTRRPGASEVQLRVFDEDKMRSVHVSTGVVPLHSLPKNGDWSENLVVPLFPDGPSAAAEHAGESKGFLVVRCAASSPVPRKLTAETPTPTPAPSPRAGARARLNTHTGFDAAAGLPGAALSPAAFSFWPNAPSPPPPPPGRYANKMESSSFVYFQVCGARDLPTPRAGGQTNFRATVALNSERDVKRTEVQEDVLADSVWVPEVFSFPRNPNSRFVTVRVYGAATKLWDPDAISSVAKGATLGLVDVGAAAADGEGGGAAGKKKRGGGEKKEDFDFSVSSAAGAAAEGLRKKRFASGTLIGEVKIPVEDLVVGADVEPVWVPLSNARSAVPKRVSRRVSCARRAAGAFGVFGAPRWLTDRGDRLGEICVAARAGRLRQPPEDLVNSSDYGTRPCLGSMEVQIVSAEGDERALDAAKGDPAGWFKRAREPSASGNGSGTLANISARLRGVDGAEGDAAFEDSESEDAPREVPANARITEEEDAPANVAPANEDASLSEPGDGGSARRPPRELLGTRVSARLVFEGRSERVASPFEHRAFDVTEPTAELRVLLFGEGALALDEVFLGAAVLPASAVLDAPNRTFDGWLDVFGASAHNTEADLQDVEYRVRLKPTRARGGWKARVRVRASIRIDAPLYRWYLRQPARSPGRGGGDSKTRVDDTIRGVVDSLERVVTAFLAPVTAPVAALAHCQSPHDAWLRRTWIAWHTLVSFAARRHVLGAFKPLWYVSGCVFIGYAAARARNLDSPAEPYHGARVARGLRDGTPEDAPDALEKKQKETQKRKRKNASTNDDSSTDPPDAAAAEDRETESHAAASEIDAMAVAGFERESEAETRRLRVQRWLKEHRVRRNKVLLALEAEAREEALRARGKSPKAVIALVRRAEGAADRRGGRGGGGDASAADASSADDDEPIQWLLKRLRLRKFAKLIASANPAEIVMRLLQQVTWTLLMTLKSTGATLFNVTVSLGRVHRMLAGPCRKLCSILDPIADSLERLGGVLSWRDERLSTYVAVVLVALALVVSVLLRVLVVPLRHALDAHSPLRLWHLAWLVGVLPCTRRVRVASDVCVKIVVICERLVQNLLGALHVAPISPYSLLLLERALEEEFAACGGSWEGVEAMYRAQEKENLAKLDERDAAENATLKDELRKGTGANPLRWLAHATRRAPTRAEYEHKKLVERLVGTNEEGQEGREGP
jgi:hypothetical protein